MPERYAILAVPGFFHGWIVDALRSILLSSGLKIDHRFITENDAHHCFAISSDLSEKEIQIVVLNFASTTLIADILSGAVPCLMVDEALPHAAAALEANGTCQLEAGMRAITNVKAMYRELIGRLPEGAETCRYLPVRSKMDVLEGLKELLAAAEVHFMPDLKHRAGPLISSFQRFAAETANLVSERIPGHSNLIEGDWLSLDDFKVSLDRRFFVLGDSPTEPVDGFIDVTGPARILVGGPYIFMPRGLVQCVLSFSVSEELYGEDFQINVYSSKDQLASLTFRVDGRGPVQVRFVIENPCHRTPVDVHLLNFRGAIEGILYFEGITFSGEAPWRKGKRSAELKDFHRVA
nr:hypothetical protein [uncultured Roseococcus sp.]